MGGLCIQREKPLHLQGGLSVDHSAQLPLGFHKIQVWFTFFLYIARSDDLRDGKEIDREISKFVIIYRSHKGVSVLAGTNRHVSADCTHVTIMKPSSLLEIGN